jgi:hypothetical protein
MAEFTDYQIACAASELEDRMAELLIGNPTAAAYIAIARVLARMEMQARRPDRAALFGILGRGGMDDFIRQNTPAFQ